MVENKLKPADIMRGMVVILNPREIEEGKSCPIDFHKTKKVMELNECET